MAYARGVVAGEIVACQYVRQACQRHLDDLVASDNPLYPYRFDEGKANRFCWITSKFPHVSGKWARRVRGEDNRITWEPWQCFIFCCMFGWVKKTTGKRRFRKAYIETNRKSSKSTMAACVANYMLACDGEIDAQVFAGATKEKQAMEVFRPARMMAMRSHKFLLAFGVEVNKKSLTRIDGSRFEPLVKNPGDGSSPSCAIVDEYHEHADDTLYNAMESGMGAREQPLLFVITTAGFNIGGPCHQLRKDIVQILSGAIRDDEQFGIIYTLDKLEEYKTDEGILKANPNVGVSVSWDFLRARQQEAIKFAHKTNAILTKHFGWWTNAATSWMNMEKLKSCVDPSLDIRDFYRKQCFEGADLAAKIDLASRALLFKIAREDELVVDEATGETEKVVRDHYYYFGYHYCPKATIHDGEHSNYEQWVHEKALIPVDGAEIRLPHIETDISRDFELFDMQSAAFDPWSALQMQQNLQARWGESKIVTIQQTTQYLSDPMKEIQAAVYSGRFHYNGDPVFTWAMSNVEVEERQNDTVFPRRGKDNKRKIDPVAALITAMNRAYSAPAQRASVYEGRGILVL